jgi:hypothetical protein
MFFHHQWLHNQSTQRVAIIARVDFSTEILMIEKCLTNFRARQSKHMAWKNAINDCMMQNADDRVVEVFQLFMDVNFKRYNSRCVIRLWNKNFSRFQPWLGIFLVTGDCRDESIMCHESSSRTGIQSDIRHTSDEHLA